MSPITPDRAIRDARRNVPIFAALGDRTRLSLLAKLASGKPASISLLARGSPLTRQAITKHLHVLQRAHLVRALRRGRENLFQLNPTPLNHARHSLDQISQQWTQALSRLKSFVEK